MSKCIAMSDVKECSLYFNRVLPFNVVEFCDYDLPPLSDNYSNEQFMQDLDLVVIDGLENHREIVAELVLGSDGTKLSTDTINEVVDEISVATYDIQEHRRISFPTAFYNAQYILPQYHIHQQAMALEDLNTNAELKSLEIGAADRLETLCSKFGFDNSSLYLPDLPNFREVCESRRGQSLEVSMVNARVIDVENSPWEQILEVRRDADAKKRLIRFRIEAAKLLSPFDDGFEDRLLLAMHDYEIAARKHGFETTSRTLKSLVDIKALSIWGVALSPTILSAVPDLATAGATTIAIANYAFEIRESLHLSRDFAKQHPLAFIGKDLAPFIKRA